MFLKNYTSEAPVSQTVYRIEQVLIKCGVSGIMKEYGAVPGHIIAVTFQIKTGNEAPMTVRLPVNVAKAQRAMWLDYVDGDALAPCGTKLASGKNKKKCMHDFREQAERTAWKIIQEWVEIQMSMIQMNQADFREVFLPYIWDGTRTIYQRVADDGFRSLLLPEKT